MKCDKGVLVVLWIEDVQDSC